MQEPSESGQTWVVLGEARQGLRGVNANIILGKDDLAVQPRAQR